MADKLKLEINGKPVECALTYAKAMVGQSKIPGKGAWFLYTLASGQVLFIDEDDCPDPDRMFADANIRAGEAFTISLRKTKTGARYYEVKALASEPQLDPSRYPDENGRVTALETKLVASI